MRLSRREMLAALLGAPLAAELGACERDGGQATAPIEGELLGQSHGRGHALRSPPSDADFSGTPLRHCDVVIVGGGPAGLSAGYQLRKRGVDDIRLLELEPNTGGTSTGGQSDVTAYPWAAHYITRPASHNAPLVALLEELGVVSGHDERGMPRVAEQYLVRQQKERVFYRGFWYPGLIPNVDARPQELAEQARFAALMLQYARMRDGRGRPAFAIPISHASDDATLLALDRQTAHDFLRGHGFSSKRLYWYADYACRDDYGLGLEHVSAWALVFYFASRLDAAAGESAPVITWPEGNAHLTDHLRKALGDRVETGQLVVDIRPGAKSPSDDRSAPGLVEVRMRSKNGEPERIRARRVVCATPQFIARRIVQPLRDSDSDVRDTLSYGAWMVANLHLRDRPPSHGVPEAWDSVLYDSPSLGYVSATHQRGRSFGPTVWSYYLPMTDGDAHAGRRRLMQGDWAHFRDAVLGDLGRAHRGLPQHVQRLDVFRWGHAMVQPRPGLRTGRGLDRARAPLGCIHFAHSDLSGVALFEEAFDHGLRAADEVAAALQQGQAG